MLVRTITRLTAAAALAATLAACGDTETDNAAADETEAAAEEGGADAEADAATAEGSDASAAGAAEEEEEAATPWVGAWVEDGPDAAELELRDDGTVWTNEPSLPEGTWEEDRDGIMITFAGRNTVRMPGRMDGETLVLTAPDGETGRFLRATGGAARGSGASSGGSKPD